MRRFILLLLAGLFLSVQGMGTLVFAWTCEGKTCSPLSLRCCCEVPSQQHPDCLTDSKNSGACAGDCDCKLSVVSNRAHEAVRSADAGQNFEHVSLTALLPPELELPTPVLLTYAPVLANPPPGFLEEPLERGAPFRAPPAPFV